MKWDRGKHAQSYAHGGGGPPLVGTTVSGVLDLAAANWSGRDALIVPDQDVGWSSSRTSEHHNQPEQCDEHISISFL
ncbi:MAG: hypothetical protein OEM25_01140 [Gammaproteobacteria bacterium]|nr:hypothetical protein [Gammaproteobacteria bacterium]